MSAVTCPDCQSDKLTVLAVGPDLRTILLRCARCGRETVVVVPSCPAVSMVRSASDRNRDRRVKRILKRLNEQTTEFHRLADAATDRITKRRLTRRNRQH